MVLMTCMVAVASAGVYQDTITATNPVIYWDFQGGSLDDLAPASGNNMATLGVDTSTGMSGPGSTFIGLDATNEGLSHYVNTGAAAYFVDGLNTTANVPNTAYSMMTWFNSSNIYNHQALNYIMGRGNVSEPTVPTAVTRDSITIGGSYNSEALGKLSFWDGVSPGSSFATGTTTLSPGTWYNLVMVRDADQVTVYLNGQQEVSTTSAWQGGYGDLFVFGGRADSISKATMAISHYGAMDEMAVWDRALTAGEVAGFYELAPVVIPDPDVDYPGYVTAHAPEAYWRFNEAAATPAAVDASGNGRDLTLLGGTLGAAGATDSQHAGLEASSTAITLNGTRAGEVSDVLGGASGYMRNFTAEMWFKRGALESGAQWLLYRNGYEIDGASPDVGDFMGLALDEETGEVNIAVGNGILYDVDPEGGDPIPSDGNDWFQGETDIVEGQWYHLAISNEANAVKVYLDGQLEGTDFIRARGGYMLAGGDWTIGGRGGTDNEAFVGTIDELAIYRGIKDAEFFLERFPTAVLLAGDANGDGIVDDEDAAILASNWMGTDKGWGEGDFNGDGVVNDIDATLLATNWQTAAPPSAVPEPGTLVLLLGLGAVFLCRRTRRG